jgi:hypothetical protein
VCVVVICTVCTITVAISMVTASTLELRLLDSECINNHKRLTFFVMVLFYLHPCIITFSTLRGRKLNAIERFQIHNLTKKALQLKQKVFLILDNKLRESVW